MMRMCNNTDRPNFFSSILLEGSVDTKAGHCRTIRNQGWCVKDRSRPSAQGQQVPDTAAWTLKGHTIEMVVDMCARKAHFYDRDNQMRVTLSGLPDSVMPCVGLYNNTATAVSD